LIRQPSTVDTSVYPQQIFRLSSAAASAATHPLTLLLIAFFCTSLLWALVVEPGGAPDEWDHFDYIRSLVASHSLPIYGQTPRFDNPNVLNSEAQQPPLYYLLATPFYLLGGQTPAGQMVAARLCSILLGTVAVALTYTLGRALAPKRRAFALALAALVGFNPMFMYMSAAVSNDALINAIYPALMLLLQALLQQRFISWKWLLGLGALLGAGLLAKFSIVGGVLASGIVLAVLAWRQPDRRIRTLLIYGAWTAGGLLLVAGWYLARNWLLYGDPSGVLIMASYHVNPMQPYATVGSFWQMLTTRRTGFVDFWPGLLHGFWGIFDFYIIWMAPRLYFFLDVLGIGGLIGTGIWASRAWARHSKRATQERLVLAAAAGLITLITLGLVINYSYRIDYQPQGRYLLAALVPIGLAIVTGWEQLLRLVKLQHLAAPLLIVVILGINLLALFTAIAPDYHDAYLTSLTTQPEAPTQYIAGAFAASASFVAEQSQIEQLEVLLNRPANASGPIIWRLRQGSEPAEIATAVEPKPPKGITRYRISVPQPLRAGAAYTLSIQAPWVAEDKRLAAYLRPNQAGGDMNLQVVYPPRAGWAALRRIDYLLRSAAPGWPRGNGQRLLFVCAPLLMLALAARAFGPLLGRGWSWLAGTATVAFVLAALWAPPQVTGHAIPTRTLDAAPGPLLTLDDSKGSTDLILLSGSAAAHVYPPGDPAQRVSQIQPYRFTIADDTRAVLAMQPPSAITYTLYLPARAALRTAIALNPEIWQPDKGDGVEFLIQLEAADGSHELLRRWIDPKHEPIDRRWHDIAIDLSAYAGQNVRLTLRTLPGPAGDGRYDWAGWGAPVIVQQPE
jgi:4-amino-4-deoxy-L-arabinose transferase-like glycosyltransferase